MLLIWRKIAEGSGLIFFRFIDGFYSVAVHLFSFMSEHCLSWCLVGCFVTVVLAFILEDGGGSPHTKLLV